MYSVCSIIQMRLRKLGNITAAPDFKYLYSGSRVHLTTVIYVPLYCLCYYIPMCYCHSTGHYVPLYDNLMFYRPIIIYSDIQAFICFLVLQRAQQ